METKQYAIKLPVDYRINLKKLPRDKKKMKTQQSKTYGMQQKQL